MSALAELLKQYGDGGVDDASAVEKVKSLLTPPEKADESKPLMDRYGDSLLADDNDYDNTWQEVSAAKVMGKISDEQYQNLYTGIFGGGEAPKEKPAES